MHFTVHQKVLFKHCDPAGIAFYPRYFEMINDAVEAMFADLLNWPFEEVHTKGAVPTASFKVDFKSPSRHGDNLDLKLHLLRLGGSSLTLKTTTLCEDELRFTAEQVIVCVNAEGRPTRWPAPVVTKINSIMEGAQ